MVFVVMGFLCVFATDPPGGSCATPNGNRCSRSVTDGCGCDANCLSRDNCCADYSTVCVGACPANSADVFVCRDGTECDPLEHPAAYGCCGPHGGKFKCPSSLPYMCSGVNGESCGDDHCCFNTPQMCAHRSVDRSLLQDCPALQSGTPSICPHLHGPQQLLPERTNFIGSVAHRIRLKETASMETRVGGKFAPGGEWEFCTPHGESVNMLCKNGKQCDVVVDGWACCAKEGGRLRCPAEAPVMCDRKTCGGGDHCCAVSGVACLYGPLHECPTSEVVIPATNDTTIRQCSLNTPVLCKDNTCAVTKLDCADGVQIACPEVPQCEATGEWEATPVGGTAYALCDKDATREGRKYRACVSKFAGGKEMAVWARIMDGDRMCRPVKPRCSSVKTANGVRIPYLSVGMYTRVPKTDCPQGKKGVDVYLCASTANQTTYSITPLCSLPCTREEYCSDRGNATSTMHDLSSVLGDACRCTCEDGWGGVHCNKKILVLVDSRSISTQGLLWVSLAMLFAATVLMVCAAKRKLTSKVKAVADIEGNAGFA